VYSLEDTSSNKIVEDLMVFCGVPVKRKDNYSINLDLFFRMSSRKLQRVSSLLTNIVLYLTFSTFYV
jgi:TRAP-type C4-dicarboxylate transport system permease small subunit